MTSNATSSYLEKSSYWWSFSPSSFRNSRAFVRVANDDLSISSGTNSSEPIRPVINLKDDVIVTTGDGTKSNPYKIKT